MYTPHASPTYRGICNMSLLFQHTSKVINILDISVVLLFFTSYPDGSPPTLANADGPTPTASGLLPGEEYVFQLTVSDGQQSDTDTVVIVVIDRKF